MKSNVKKQWLVALRSGNYRKCMGQLKMPGTKNTKAKYCALGVLCNIYKKETGKGKWNGLAFETENSESCIMLPISVKNWAGLNRESPKLMFDGAYRELIGLNDGDSEEPLSFKEIANLIEKQIPG